MTGEEAHRRARDKGVSGPLYRTVRGTVVPFMRVWFRLTVSGAEHVPEQGAAVVAPNHKSFWDSFFIAAGTKRHLRFMGKVELFEGWKGPLLVRLGAFPVKRGESDAEATETALEILRQGGLLALFPEGTRIRDPDELGDPKRGAGRLALEAGAPVVPAAIVGTEDLFAGPLPKPKLVQVAFAEPIPVSDLAPSQEAASELIEELVWPEVQTEFRRLRSRRTVIAATLAALGIGGAGVAARRSGVKLTRSKARPWLPGRRSKHKLPRLRR